MQPKEEAAPSSAGASSWLKFALVGGQWQPSILQRGSLPVAPLTAPVEAVGGEMAAPHSVSSADTEPTSHAPSVRVFGGIAATNTTTQQPHIGQTQVECTVLFVCAGVQQSPRQSRNCTGWVDGRPPAAQTASQLKERWPHATFPTRTTLPSEPRDPCPPEAKHSQ